MLGYGRAFLAACIITMGAVFGQGSTVHELLNHIAASKNMPSLEIDIRQIAMSASAILLAMGFVQVEPLVSDDLTISPGTSLLDTAK